MKVSSFTDLYNLAASKRSSTKKVGLWETLFPNCPSSWKKQALAAIKGATAHLNDSHLRELGKNVNCSEMNDPEACQLVKSFLLILAHREVKAT